VERDVKSLGGTESANDKFIQRYHAASQIYIDECQPETIANIVIDNTDFTNLIIAKNERR